MPVWISVELEATNTMSVAQFGARTRLLYNAWSKGPLPNDATALARMIGVTVDEFHSAVYPILEAEFELSKDGWINKAIEIERAKSIGYRARAAERTARGGDSTKARWKADPEGMAAALAEKKAASLAAKKAASLDEGHEPRLVDGHSSQELSESRSASPACREGERGNPGALRKIGMSALEIEEWKRERKAARNGH